MTAYSDEVVLDAPLKYLRFEETTGTYSSSVGTTTTTMFGTPSRISPGTADSELAVGFPTINDYVQIGAIGAIPTTAKRASFSWEAWFKVPALTAVDTGQGSYQLVGTNARGDTFTRLSWSMEMIRTTGVDLGKIEVSATSGSDKDAVKSLLRLDDNKWHHAVATYDGTNLRLYIDGALKATAAHTVAVNPGALAPVIGRAHPSTTVPANVALAFPGAIDEVAIYETVLSAARILKHYEVGATIFSKWYRWNGVSSERLSTFRYTGTGTQPISTEVVTAYVPNAVYGTPPATTFTTLSALTNPYPGNVFPTSTTYQINGSGTFNNYRFPVRVNVVSGTVVFNNCLFEGAPFEGPVTNSSLLSVTSGATSVTATRCTFNPAAPNASHDAVAGTRFILDACDLLNTVNGARIEGGAATVKNSWIHSLNYYDNNSNPTSPITGTHNMGVKVRSGAATVIQNNLLQGPMNGGGVVIAQEAALTAITNVNVDGNTFEITGDTDDISVHDTLGPAAIASLTIKNNKFNRNLAKNQMKVSTRTIRNATTVYDKNGWMDASSSVPKVFAHYFPPFPISIDNAAPASDYYTTQYLNRDGEGGIHRIYGGYLRDRPVEQAALAGTDWKTQNYVKEINQAASFGIDGFFIDILQLTGLHADNIVFLYDAVLQADKYFVLCPQIDATAGPGSATPSAIATYVAPLLAHPNAFRLPTGESVLSAFAVEQKPVSTFWQPILDFLRNDFALKVAFFPMTLDISSVLVSGNAISSISYGIANWGVRNPDSTNAGPTYSKTIHSQGLKYMQSISVQDTRPKLAAYWEAKNLAQLRASWARALGNVDPLDAADYVCLNTWNDYSEHTGFAPSKYHTYNFGDVSAYYGTRFRTGAYPTITQDAVYLTHRRQPFGAAISDTSQTTLQSLFNSSATPAVNTVEAMVFLTAAADVNITVAGTTTTSAAPAGVSQYTVSLAAGAISVTVTRGATLVASTASSMAVTTTPVNQDLQYFASGSLRQPASLAVAANPMPFTPDLPGQVAPPFIVENTS